MTDQQEARAKFWNELFGYDYDGSEEWDEENAALDVYVAAVRAESASEVAQLRGALETVVLIAEVPWTAASAPRSLTEIANRARAALGESSPTSGEKA